MLYRRRLHCKPIISSTCLRTGRCGSFQFNLMSKKLYNHYCIFRFQHYPTIRHTTTATMVDMCQRHTNTLSVATAVHLSNNNNNNRISHIHNSNRCQVRQQFDNKTTTTLDRFDRNKSFNEQRNQIIDIPKVFESKL